MCIHIDGKHIRRVCGGYGMMKTANRQDAFYLTDAPVNLVPAFAGAELLPFHLAIFRGSTVSGDGSVGTVGVDSSS